MKKLVLTMLLITGLVLGINQVSSAAEGCVMTSVTTMPNDTKDTKISRKYRMLVTCTAAANGELNSSNTLTVSDMTRVDGTYLYKIVTQPGGTAPTDGSSLAIADSRGLNFITAAGNGAALVDATSTLQEYPEGPNTDDFQLLQKDFPLSFTITDNVVDSAIVLIYLESVE